MKDNSYCGSQRDSNVNILDGGVGWNHGKGNNNKSKEFKIKRFVSDKMEAKKIHKLLMILLLQNQELNVATEIELHDPKH